jgi:hypothetical protein
MAAQCESLQFVKIYVFPQLASALHCHFHTLNCHVIACFLQLAANSRWRVAAACNNQWRCRGKIDQSMLLVILMTV